MRRDAHERFEALAVAHALGEASAAERAEFAAHARGCRTCADDAAGALAMANLIAGARDEERWQPQLDGALETRLAGRRVQRSQQTFAVLGYAVAASFVLNIAFVGGFAGRALDALRVTPPPERYANAARIVLEHRARRPLVPAAVAARPRAVPQVRLPARAADDAARKPDRLALATASNRNAPPAPDVFAGLALGTQSSGASVAFAQLCAEARTDDEPIRPGCPTPEVLPAR